MAWRSARPARLLRAGPQSPHRRSPRRGLPPGSPDTAEGRGPLFRVSKPMQPFLGHQAFLEKGHPEPGSCLPRGSQGRWAEKASQSGGGRLDTYTLESWPMTERVRPPNTCRQVGLRCFSGLRVPGADGPRWSTCRFPGPSSGWLALNKPSGFSGTGPASVSSGLTGEPVVMSGLLVPEPSARPPSSVQREPGGLASQP